MFQGTRSLVAPAVATLLSGCGVAVPDIKEPWDGPYGTRQIEFEVKKTVFCKLGEAIRTVNWEYTVMTRSGAGAPLVKRQFIPNNYVAQISLSFEVDESGGLNPGVSLISPLANSQSFSLGLGGTLSSTASRIDKFDPTYSVSSLMIEPGPEAICNPKKDPYYGSTSSSPLIVDDLGIQSWLEDAMWTNIFIPSTASPNAAGMGGAGGGQPGSSPKPQSGGTTPDTISIEIKFVIQTSGNVTPTWKLIRLSANTGTAPFVGVGRTRTHDLIITIGPNKTSTTNSHLASQIGQAVSSGNRSLLTAPQTLFSQ